MVKRSRALVGLTAILAVLALAGLSSQSVPTPSDYLKIKIGADHVLADYGQIVAYWKAVDQLSDRIQVEEIGTSTEGQPYILAIISSPENLRNLEKYREINNRLYDPRKTTQAEADRLIPEAKTIVAIQMSIHATEVGGTQMGLELAYRFATANTPRMRAILDNTIILLSPSHNPDGSNIVADWNRRTAGTKFEGAPLPVLYQKYVGHDNNRDWYMYTQKENQISVEKIWNRWHPQISYDLHQMGSNAARLFTPPYVDPYDPNVDPILRAETSFLGSSMASRLTGEGKDGVVINAMYDAWTPARGYVNYHGGIRILTEAASVKLASPITIKFDQLGRGIGYDAKKVAWNFPRPWRGGVWRLRDIMDYEHLAVDAVLDHAAKYREEWLRNFYRVNANSVGRIEPETGKEKPYAIVVPLAQKDPAASAKMLWAYQFGDVEISRAKAPFTADGREYPAGTHVILMSQPASSFAKTLTEIQNYPDLRQYPGGPPQRPYDVTAYTMPLLMGVEATFVQKPFAADLELVTAPIAPLPGAVVGGKAKRAYVFGHDNAGIMALIRLQKERVQVGWAEAPFTAGGKQYPAGTMVVPVARQPKIHETMTALAAALPVQVIAVNEAVPPARSVGVPRLGMYKSYLASMDEGWTRWLLEQWGIQFTSIENKEIRSGNLRAKYDAIILPDESPLGIINGSAPGSTFDEYVGGIGQEGVAALKAFAEAGGTIIALDSACMLPIEQFKLPVRNVLAGGEERGGGGGSIGPSSADFYAPGSIVKTLVEVGHPVAYGSEPEGMAWFEQSPAFEVSGNAVAVVKYPAQGKLLLSGWLLGGERLNGKAAVVEAPIGSGRAVLFGFRPQYRAQTWATFKLLFNAIYSSALAPPPPVKGAKK